VPEAVPPAPPRPRTVPRPAVPPQPRHQPGDRICGQCGTPNRPTRHFCQRCGASLVEAPAARVPWYRRLLRPRQAPAAGERRRIPRPSAGGSVVLLAVLAVALAGGGLAYASVPSLHRQLNQGASSITTQLRRSINPIYTP